jgi:hypothetical protein
MLFEKILRFPKEHQGFPNANQGFAKENKGFPL